MSCSASHIVASGSVFAASSGSAGYPRSPPTPPTLRNAAAGSFNNAARGASTVRSALGSIVNGLDAGARVSLSAGYVFRTCALPPPNSGRSISCANDRQNNRGGIDPSAVPSGDSKCGCRSVSSAKYAEDSTVGSECPGGVVVVLYDRAVGRFLCARNRTKTAKTQSPSFASSSSSSSSSAAAAASPAPLPPWHHVVATKLAAPFPCVRRRRSVSGSPAIAPASTSAARRASTNVAAFASAGTSSADNPGAAAVGAGRPPSPSLRASGSIARAGVVASA
eukprot:30626-Pelagococcus_subviridis.AAC.2